MKISVRPCVIIRFLSLGIIAAATLLIARQVNADSAPVTMASYGQRKVVIGTEGDTWDSSWLANGSIYLQNNDGAGWGSSDTGLHDCLSLLQGSPDDLTTIAGQNLNPGSLGSFLGGTYSTSTYELAGALYHVICYSNQTPGAFAFYHSSILKSTDGGANWTNHLGQVNVLPPNDAADCMFPDDRISDVSFIKYGRGGDAPAIDNAQSYAYLVAPDAVLGNNLYLARLSLTDLATLNKSGIQYYTGGDGLSDQSWSTSSSSAAPIYTASGQCSPVGVIYNYGLQRYILTTQNSDSWSTPPIESTLYVLEAPQPWGPWTKVLEENVQAKEEDNLSWPFPLQSEISADGQKMWITISGRNPYGLQFIPIYLTTGAVLSYEAEDATLTGTVVDSSKAGYSGTGYVTGFSQSGAACSFNVNVEASGVYMLNLRYDTNAHETISCYVNGAKIQRLALGDSEQVYTTWTDFTLLAWLNSGSNTISLQQDPDDSGNINLDKLSIAFYSADPSSLPTANSPAEINDTSFTYTGTWYYDNGPTRVSEYHGDIHYSDTVGSQVQYSFNGTGFAVVGEKAPDLGTFAVYVDNLTVPIATIDPSNPVKLYQQELYANTGLSYGPHTVQLVMLSGPYMSVDAMRIFSGDIVVNDTNFSLQGTWTYSADSTRVYDYNGDLHYTATPGDFAEFTFVGSGVDLIGENAANLGDIDIYLDDLSSPIATVSAYAPTRSHQNVLYSSSALSTGLHTIRMVMRTGSYMSVDALRVHNAAGK